MLTSNLESYHGLDSTSDSIVKQNKIDASMEKYVDNLMAEGSRRLALAKKNKYGERVLRSWVRTEYESEGPWSVRRLHCPARDTSSSKTVPNKDNRVGTRADRAAMRIYRVRCTDIFCAALKNELSEVERYLDAGFDVNSTALTTNVETVLHNAVLGQNPEMVSLLLGRGADVNKTDNTGNSPLHLAAMWGHATMVRLLLKNGADPKLRNEAGNRPSQMAASNGMDETAELCRC